MSDVQRHFQRVNEIIAEHGTTQSALIPIRRLCREEYVIA